MEDKENKKYNHKEIELKWQNEWQKNDIYKTLDKFQDKENFYTLVEFPYPSGNLHIGHWYAFAVPDIFARTKRMQGFNVMFPIGFDAFGLPAENAAIKRGLDPKKWTYENIAYMERQLASMGNSFDWSRKVITSDPEYYRWTQWLFLELFKKGLAYKKKALVNWCPSCQTVLANEQVVNGKCERCGSEVIQKDLEQWFFKITDYAERLISDLDNLDWPEPIKDAQRNWIGKSSGAEISFELKAKSLESGNLEASSSKLSAVKVFTTRADTLFGATYLVLAPEYKEIENLKLKIENWDEVQDYINGAKNKTEIERTDAKKEKTGVKLDGVTAINPANGEEIPVFVADYVLGNYGTGAVMAVPAHDERDFEFAKKYNLPIVQVIQGGEVLNNAYIDEGVLINSKEFDGMESELARGKITEKFGQKEIKYKLRDWLLSRQRYWGCPIPVVYDPEGNAHPVKEEHLPWLLPGDNIDFTPKGTSPLASSKELKERVEKLYGKGWTPEFDTMDTFVDSSWYFLRYCDPHNSKLPASSSKLKSWMPVSRYSGGAEHTTMHLLYSRFFHKALFDLGLVNEDEPFKIRMNRGLILGPDGQKMSKSKGNVIDPDEWVEKVGADTVRMYLAFIGPYNEVGQYPWDLGGIAGMRRFLERVWKLSLKVHKGASLESKNKKEEILSNSETFKLDNLLHKTIKKVTEDIENYKFNTAISSLMILFNELEKEESKILNPKSRENFEIFLKLLAPFAPHITEEIWFNFDNSDSSRIRETNEDERNLNVPSIHLEKWPKFDESKIIEENTTIVVQINGKVRAQFEAPINMSENEAKEMANALPDVFKWLENKEIKKVIFVPNKIVNFVVV